MTMQWTEIQTRSNIIRDQLRENSTLGKYVDDTLPIPRIYRGTGEIRLIILGQDPTVKNPISRKKVQTVLNLDPMKRGHLWNYLTQVCQYLGLDLCQNVYATNLYKNFFVAPPTQIEEVDIFADALPFWLPLLEDELAEFSESPVVTLGEPLLSALVKDPSDGKVRDYWGYLPGWKNGESKGYTHLPKAGNCLDRTIFPYPHQPSIQKQFYRDRLISYTTFTRREILNMV
jgi:hypothetical protein